MKKKRGIGASIGVVSIVMLIVPTVLFGAWWRTDLAPSPDEWSALFTGLALIGVVFAWRQLKQVDVSNRELAASNELSTRINKEAVRPRVVVYVDIYRFVPRRRGQPFEGKIYIAVENIGSSPALNVRLDSSPLPTVSVEHFTDGDNSHQNKRLAEAFSGKSPLQVMVPGKVHTWWIGNIPRVFNELESGAGLQGLEISVSYEWAVTSETFVEKFPIDLSRERDVPAEVDQLTRIGVDLLVIGERLQEIKNRM